MCFQELLDSIPTNHCFIHCFIAHFITRADRIKEGCFDGRVKLLLAIAKDGSIPYITIIPMTNGKVNTLYIMSNEKIYSLANNINNLFPIEHKPIQDILLNVKCPYFYVGINQ